MARVCFVSSVHPLHDHRFLYAECAALRRAGHEVSFIVQADEDRTLEGVRIVALPQFGAAQRRSPYRRFLRVPLVVRKMLATPADVYHLCDAELLPGGLLVKLLTGRQVVYDDHEDIPAFILMKEYIARPIARLLRWTVMLFEAAAARTFDGFVLADRGMAEGLRGLAPARKHIFFNFPPLGLFERNPIAWRQRRYDVVFLGTMSVHAGVPVLLEALSELKRSGRPIRALFIGSPRFDDFERRVRDLGLADAIEVTGQLDYARVPALLNDCRIGLIGLLDMPKFRRNLATKLFEYWAKSLPVVSSDLPPEREFLEPGRTGVLVEPGNAKAFAAAIAAMLDDPEAGERMAAEARSLVERNGYFAEREMAGLAEFYAWLLEHPR